MLKITVITVVYNCVDTVAGTINSVLDQTYKNIEYIVIDGLSTDGTERYLDTIKNNLSVYISEPDNGLYDAMNKGIRFAKGDYIIFMNAGDTFVSKDVIENIMTNNEIIDRKPKIISGRTHLSYKGRMLNITRPTQLGRVDTCLPHQATFVDAKLQKQYLYDSRFRFAADYELWLRLKRLGVFDVEYIANIVAVFNLGGRSNDVRYDSIRYLERAYIDSLYTKKFNLINWFSLFMKIVSRRMIYTLAGERALYSFLCFNKKYISEKSI